MKKLSDIVLGVLDVSVTPAALRYSVRGLGSSLCLTMIEVRRNLGVGGLDGQRSHNFYLRATEGSGSENSWPLPAGVRSSVLSEGQLVTARNNKPMVTLYPINIQASSSMVEAETELTCEGCLHDDLPYRCCARFSRVQVAPLQLEYLFERTLPVDQTNLELVARIHGGRADATVGDRNDLPRAKVQRWAAIRRRSLDPRKPCAVRRKAALLAHRRTSDDRMMRRCARNASLPRARLPQPVCDALLRWRVEAGYA